MGRNGSDVAKDAEPMLIASFQNGLNVTQACLRAGITRETFYTKCESDPKYSDRMENAQQFVNMTARKNIVEVIDKGNVEKSQWWLERKDKEFKPKTDVTSGGKTLQTATINSEDMERLQNIITKRNANSRPDGSDNNTGGDRSTGGSEGEGVSTGDIQPT